MIFGTNVQIYSMSELRKNIFYSSLLTVSNLILPFFTFPYVTRVLGPEGIGIVNFANSVVQYLIILSSLGIPFYGVREISKARNNIGLRSQILYELTIIKILVTIVVLIAYLTFVLSNEKFISTLSYWSWGLSAIIISIFDFTYFFSGLEKFKYITTRTFFYQLLFVSATFLLIKTKDDALTYFALPIVMSLLMALTNIAYAKKYIKCEYIKLSFKVKRHIKPIFLMFLMMLFSSVYNLLDVAVLGWLAEYDNVGYYTVASKLTKVILAAVMIMAPVMLSRISLEIENKNYDEIERLTSKTINFVVLLGVPLMIGLYVSAPEVIYIIAGVDYIESVDTVRIMSPVALIVGLTTNFSTQLLIPMGKEKEVLYAVIVGAFFSLALNLILIPTFQHNGAAISILITELVVLLICQLSVKELLKIHVPYRLILINIIYCLPFFLFAYIGRCLLTSPMLIFFFICFASSLYYMLIQIYLLKNKFVLEMKELFVKKLNLV